MIFSRKKPDCTSVDKLIGAYHDNELKGRKWHMVEEHITSCPRCSRELSTLGRLSAVIKTSAAQLAEGMPDLSAMISFEAGRRARLRSSGVIVPLYQRFSFAHAVAVAALLVAFAASLVTIPVALARFSGDSADTVESIEYASGNVTVTTVDSGRSTVVWVSDDDEAG